MVSKHISRLHLIYCLILLTVGAVRIVTSLQFADIIDPTNGMRKISFEKLAALPGGATHGNTTKLTSFASDVKAQIVEPIEFCGKFAEKLV